ncbi:MAG: YtxH domain-containing protein [Armatimonadota bacterium]
MKNKEKSMANCDESTSVFGILSGMLVGLAIGAAVALLYAPQSGRETREDLAESLNELRERVDDLTHKVADEAQARFAETKADIVEAVEAGRAAATEKAQTLRKKAGLA